MSVTRLGVMEFSSTGRMRDTMRSRMMMPSVELISFPASSKTPDRAGFPLPRVMKFSIAWWALAKSSSEGRVPPCCSMKFFRARAWIPMIMGACSPADS